ncbi:hypothetical protein, partial [Stutzerimonas nitrititolerans]|uniref:hypothetical protein n=1 Tax=Stutzerimonas nitrititolerans TaxID=2482751 RepID=UPI00289DB40F
HAQGAGADRRKPAARAMKTETALSRHETLGNKAGASFVSPVKLKSVRQMPSPILHLSTDTVISL